MKKAFIRILGILFVLSVIFTIVWYPGCQEAPIDIIANVGSSQITHIDCANRFAIERIYGNNSISEAVVLISLVNDELEREVERMFGISVTPDEIAQMNTHVDRTTKAPEILAKVKEAFGDDKAAYERIYIAPKILNRKLRVWYSRNPNIHKVTKVSIEKAYSLVHSGKSMEEAAHVCGLLFSTIEHERRNKVMPSALKRYFPERDISSTSDNRMTSLIEDLSEGEICKDIVESDHGYQIIKLVKKGGARYTLEAITAKKRPFQKWFLEQAEKVPVRIFDKELEKEIASHYSNVWWVKKWCKK